MIIFMAITVTASSALTWAFITVTLMANFALPWIGKMSSTADSSLPKL